MHNSHFASLCCSIYSSIFCPFAVLDSATKLYMHTDRHDTHVISSILHVYHDTNKGSEQWPLVIEGFDGQTVQVHLEPGDLLLYESSKCYHGRPKRFRGEYYTSLFLHYYPVDRRPIDESELDTHYRVPPHWHEQSSPSPPIDDDSATVVKDGFEMIDTFCREVNCEHEWCALRDSPVVQGPAPGYGKVLTSSDRLIQLKLIPDKDKQASTSSLGSAKQEEDEL